MDRRNILRSRIAAGCTLIGAALLAHAADPEAVRLNPMTPYDRSTQQQQLYDQQQQNARQQQQLQQQRQDQLYDDAARQQQARQQGDIAQGQAVLRSWQQRPPLAADKNPLLGRWNSLGSAGAKRSAPGVSPEMAQLVNGLLGGITGGMCDSMLGRGLIEFRPNAVVAIGAGGRERVMYRAEYRGGGSRVVVLPQAGQSFTHMIIDFDGRDHASVAAVGCGLTRVGGAAAAGSTLAQSAPARWDLLGSTAANGGMDVYVARSTIRKTGSTAQMTDLYDFKTVQFFEGRRYLSARNEHEYDCARDRMRLVGTIGYSDHMGQGSVIASDGVAMAWERVPPNGPIREHWTIACAKP
ncbi:MAG TPA: surface-adhesin E family protein [Burkholderiaceae bacterium]|nr:surface-adhesin E family protein [Burkholderiaceae bacterium]